MGIEAIGAVVLGLLLGSFLSVLIERWHTKDGIIAGRSRCPHCMHALAWYDLVPLFSWLVLRGRCRYCKAPIHWRYPLMELVMAGVLGGYVARWGIPSGWEAVDIVVLFGLVALFFFDMRWMLLPDVFTYSLIGLLLVRLIAHTPSAFVGSVATAVFLAALFMLLYLLTRGRGVGLGDVKFALVIGLLFPYPAAFIVTVAAIWAGAIVGVALMLLKLATRRTPMPFGSFWAAAALIAMLWPEPVAIISSWLSVQ
ncbi:MAG TPA: prepilin peptidase [Candidatus Paceibacterota bacterium]|nr:prepilin peptidase [Candidatus Paceibacterota bacterium]